MGALGYVMQVPEEEKYLMSQIQMEEELVIMLAGRAAEKIVFNSVTTGAANDIERATAMARAMVTQYGMSEKFGLMALENVQDRYLSGHTVLNCGQETATEIDNEVMRILKNAYEQAITLLEANRECLDKIADFLIEKETITGKEFMEIFRAVKGIEEPETEAKAEKVDETVKTEEIIETEEAAKEVTETVESVEVAESIDSVEEMTEASVYGVYDETPDDENK